METVQPPESRRWRDELERKICPGSISLFFPIRAFLLKRYTMDSTYLLQHSQETDVTLVSVGWSTRYYTCSHFHPAFII